MSDLKINSYVPSSDLFDKAFGTSGSTSNKSSLSTITGTSSIDDSSNDTSSASGVSFADTLTSALNSVNDKQVSAEQTSDSLVKGDDVDIADVMLKSSEAKVSLQLAVEMRNKLVSAYNEITKMSL